MSSFGMISKCSEPGMAMGKAEGAPVGSKHEAGLCAAPGGFPCSPSAGSALAPSPQSPSACAFTTYTLTFGNHVKLNLLRCVLPTFTFKAKYNPQGWRACSPCILIQDSKTVLRPGIQMRKESRIR